MKKSFKGFTLIECLIALAILGIASMMMAQVYANVSLRNRNNQIVNTSLSNQMSYVEKYTSTGAVPIYFNSDGSGNSDKDSHASGDRLPPHKSSDSANTHKDNYVQITRIDASKSGAASRVGNEVYSFPVDTFVLLSRDANNKDSSETDYKGEDEDEYNLRYKYLIGHAN